MYINFMCEPEVGAANAEYIGYSSPTTRLLNCWMGRPQESPIIYPSDGVIEKSGSSARLPHRDQLAMDKMWTEVLSNDEQYSEWFYSHFARGVCIGLSIAINVGAHLAAQAESRNY